MRNKGFNVGQVCQTMTSAFLFNKAKLFQLINSSNCTLLSKAQIFLNIFQLVYDVVAVLFILPSIFLGKAGSIKKNSIQYFCLQGQSAKLLSDQHHFRDLYVLIAIHFITDDIIIFHTLFLHFSPYSIVLSGPQ